MAQERVESVDAAARAAAGALPRDLLEAVLDRLPTPVALVEPGTAALTFVNAAARRLAGGRFPAPASVDEYADLFFCTDAAGHRVAAEDLPGPRVARGESLSGEQLDWHLPGRVASLLVSAGTIPLDDEQVVGVLAFEDVTSVRVAERMKDSSAALLDTLLSSAPVGMAFLDRDLRFVRVNPALAEMHGLAPEAHVGRTLREVLPDVDASVLAGFRQVIETGEPLVDVEVVRAVPGEAPRRRTWSESWYPVRHGTTGEVLGVGSVVTEITDRVELLEAERRARERAEAAERRAAFLAEAGEALAGSLQYEETLQRVARIAVPARADWCVVDMVGDRGAMRRVAVAHVDPALEQLAWDLARRWPARLRDAAGVGAVVRTGRPALYAEIDDRLLRDAAPDPGRYEIIRDLGLSSGIIVPLTVRGRPVGALSFARAGLGRRYDDDDLALALEIARRASTAIENARLYRERSHIAQTLQRSLLPPTLPEIAGYEVAARYRAAGEGFDVGGDFYDVFETHAGGWALALGDVCGKGPEAASLTSLGRYTMRAAAMSECTPGAVLATANDAILRERGSDRFLTAVHGCLDPEQGRLAVASAGHPPLLVLRAGGEVEVLAVPGTLLGVTADAAYHEVVVDIGPGDAVIGYTDGVLDAAAPRRIVDPGELAGIVAEHPGRSAAELAEAVEGIALAAAEGQPRDDIAVLVLRRLEG